jgi:hypothetical protein
MRASDKKRKVMGHSNFEGALHFGGMRVGRKKYKKYYIT